MLVHRGLTFGFNVKGRSAYSILILLVVGFIFSHSGLAQATSRVDPGASSTASRPLINEASSKLPWLEQSAIHLQQSHWSEAIRTATKALKSDPSSDLAYVFRAWAYIETGKVDQALVDLGIALDINPDSGIAYNNRAYAFQYKKDFERAKSDYWTACDLNFENGCHNLFMLLGTIPDNILNNIGDLLDYSAQNLSAQQWGNVIAASTQVLTIDPKNTTALTNRARALAAIDYLPKALSDTDRAIRIDEKLAIAYHYRAYIYSLMEQAQAALGGYNRACKLGFKESCKELDRLHASNKHR